MKLTMTILLLLTASACSTTKSTREMDALSSKNRELEYQAMQDQNQMDSDKKLADSMEARNKALMAEKKFNDKFEKIRKTFSKSEANVYRQGNSLVISLNGLRFPSSNADLKGENFTLLAKVQRAIGEFDNSTVTVEGHADASGGSKNNTLIAKKRALTVKNYFISNGIIEKNKISAVGFKDDLPVATNKTMSGKAQNRRVDVTITI